MQFFEHILVLHTYFKKQIKQNLYSIYIFNRIPGACLFQNIPKNSRLVGRIAEGKVMLEISCTLFLNC